ncbi:MAG: family 16 glycosylhydrolase [Bacteroidales bacterium]|nr:family 16 glycosylhydrolase [Bacteroidales bacterium]MCF8390540.1 family 16 glycosylhydrolase [Bacteroidales bacterium]
MKSFLFPLVGICLLFTISFESHSQCYELIWADEFNYTGLPDETKWKYDVGGGGWGNNELQYYTSKRIENAGVADGKLSINAINEVYLGKNYTSARLVSTNGASWLYGKIEMMAKLPSGRGGWSAFWMLPTDREYGGWPSSGEIDIMEYVGYDENIIHGTIHTEAFNHTLNTQKGGARTVATAETEYHLYTLEWSPDQMLFSVDSSNFFLFKNLRFYDYTQWPFDKRFHMIMNIAVGGNWGGVEGVDNTAFPMTMEVDYVRVYQDIGLLEIKSDSKTVSKGQQGLEFSIENNEGRTFLWSVPEGATIISRPDSSAIVVDWGCNPGVVVCSLTTSCGTQEFSYSVEIQETEIEGNLFFMQSEQILNFSVPQIGNATYSWTIPADAEIISGQDSSAVEIKWGNSFGIVELQIVSPCGTETISKQVYPYGQYPYPDPQSPALIPGVINPVNYDYGGEGVAYHELSSTNSGPGRRQDEGVDTEYYSGGENVGYITSGEWLEYTIKVETEGLYHLDIDVASASGATRGPLTIKFNDVPATEGISIPFTADWSVYNSVSRFVYLSPEDTIMRLEAGSGNFNIGMLTFTSAIGIESQGMNLDSELILYPNPVEESLYLRFKDENNFVAGKITLHDISGRIVQTVNYDTPLCQINTGELKSGVYLLKLAGKDGFFYQRKFIKK